MMLLEIVKKRIDYLDSCTAAFILAHAAWSACDHREQPGPSALHISYSLDSSNIELVTQLQKITCCDDYSNSDQVEMLKWLHSSGYSKYIARRLKTTIKKLVDWE